MSSHPDTQQTSADHLCKSGVLKRFAASLICSLMIVPRSKQQSVLYAWATFCSGDGGSVGSPDEASWGDAPWCWLR